MVAATACKLRWFPAGSSTVPARTVRTHHPQHQRRQANIATHTNVNPRRFAISPTSVVTVLLPLEPVIAQSVLVLHDRTARYRQRFRFRISGSA